MSKIEEVAKAWRVGNASFWGLPTPDFEREPIEAHELHNARAAIEATRAPTDAMNAAGVTAAIDQGLDSSDGVGPADVEEIWRNMSHAALHE